MKIPSRCRRTLVALVLAGVPSLAVGAPPPAVTPPRAPAARPAESVADGYRFSVARVVQSQTLSLDFLRPDGVPVAGTVARPSSQLSGRHTVQVHLSVQPPQPELLRNIEGLERKVTAETEVGTVGLQVFFAEPAAPGGGALWKVGLTAPDLGLPATRLRQLRGELIVWPRAVPVRIEFPVGGKLPETREAEGLRITLTQTRSRGGLFTSAFRMEWDAAQNVSHPGSDAPYGVSALSATGGVLIPNGSGGDTSRQGARMVRNCNVLFSEVTGAPTRVRVEALVRSGASRRIPFTLPDLPLPDQLPTAIEADEEEIGTGPLQPGNALYHSPGGTLRIPPGYGGTRPGEPLLAAVSRLQDGDRGPWRWLEAASGADNSALVPHLAPGRYRVMVLRATGLGAGAATPAAPVEIALGRTSSLTVSPAGVRP